MNITGLKTTWRATTNDYRFSLAQLACHIGIKGHYGDLRCIVLSAGGRAVGKARVWDLKDGKCVEVVKDMVYSATDLDALARAIQAYMDTGAIPPVPPQQPKLDRLARIEAKLDELLRLAGVEK